MNIRILAFEEAGPFEWRWPSGNLRSYDRSWQGEIAIDGSVSEFRHALGQRHAYGRLWACGVTWIKGQPVVEGIAADDHGTSRALISLIRRPDGRHVRATDGLPPEYQGFRIVKHRAEISAPYSPRSLAVKIVEDDVVAWAAHAVLRASLLGRL